MVQTSTNGLGGDAARMPSSLQQIGSTRKRELLMVIPLIAERNRRGSIELFHMSDDFGDHSAQAVPNGNDTRSIILGRFDMQHVVDPSIGHPSLENIQRGQLTGFLHPQPTLDKQLE